MTDDSPSNLGNLPLFLGAFQVPWHSVMQPLVKDLEPFSWTMSAALELRLHCSVVPAMALETTIVDTTKMLEFVAKVTLEM